MSILRSLRAIATGLALLVAMFGLMPAALAQDADMRRDKVVQTADYDRFRVAGPRGVRSCSETCTNDARCTAWTFEKISGLCHLKHDQGPMTDNTCCISGLKPTAAQADVGGKQGYCADYARAAVAANAQNTAQNCHLAGPRWSDDFQAHYTWCMGTHRDDVAAETAARNADVAQCQETANADASAKCDHFVRISKVQIETAKQAHCSLPQGDLRWGDNLEEQKQSCLRAPARVLEHTIAERETMLSRCFEAAGEAQEACNSYADKAIEQVGLATKTGCDVSGPVWSSSRAEHMQFCLRSGPGVAKAQADDRAKQIAVCSQQVARHSACDQYAEAAVQQAIQAGNQNCDVQGPNWSRYKDEHIAFCMQADDGQLRAAAAERDTGIKRCQERVAVDPDCDNFAKRSVQLTRINDEKDCGLDGEAWDNDYKVHYQFCVRSNPFERRRRFELLRRSLFACSLDHGFKLELGF